MSKALKLNGSGEFFEARTLRLDKYRNGGDEPGFADCTPPRYDRKTPILVRKRKRGPGRVLDGWRRVLGARKSGFYAVEAINLGDVDDFTALAHVVRTGLLWPSFRDPWVLCTRLEELEERRPDLAEPEAMGAFLRVPARLISAIKEIRNGEDGDSLFEAYISGAITRRELMTLARIPDRVGQKRELEQYLEGPRSASRLKTLVKARLHWRPPQPAGGGAMDAFSPAKFEAQHALDRPLQDDFERLSTKDRPRATSVLQEAKAILDGETPCGPTGAAKP